MPRRRSPFAADPYIRQRQARSVLALPLLTQAKLIGALYLENNLAPGVFAPARIAVLKLLASQAAIALENTRLYREVAEREAKIRRLVDANIIGICTWQREGQSPDLVTLSSLRPMTPFSVWWATTVRISPRAACGGRI